MKKTILAVLIVLLLTSTTWAAEKFQREVVTKTKSIDITEQIKTTPQYRAGWVYAIYTIDFPRLKDIIEYVAQDYEQLDPWVVNTTGGISTSYNVGGTPVIVYIQDQVLIIAK